LGRDGDIHRGDTENAEEARRRKTEGAEEEESTGQTGRVWRDEEMGVDYASSRVVESQKVAGVRFTVLRMSFGRRAELLGRVRELARRAEFLAAGESTGDRMDAALARAQIDRLYVSWGLQAVAGLRVDGVEATPEMLAQAGPEELFREALGLVRRETGLDEAERKNC
jgi:hypothetical protein